MNEIRARLPTKLRVAVSASRILRNRAQMKSAAVKPPSIIFFVTAAVGENVAVSAMSNAANIEGEWRMRSGKSRVVERGHHKLSEVATDAVRRDRCTVYLTDIHFATGYISCPVLMAQFALSRHHQGAIPRLDQPNRSGLRPSQLCEQEIAKGVGHSCIGPLYQPLPRSVIVG